jgi:hypothetical protein
VTYPLILYIIFEVKVILENILFIVDKFDHKACRTRVLVRAPVTMRIGS